MKMKFINLLILLCCLFCNACQIKSQSISNRTENVQTGSGQTSNIENVNVSETNLVSNSANSQTVISQTNQPKTVREFFNLLPQKYFTLESCEPQKDKNCEKARAEYIKTFLEVEDAKNGYWKSGCDGAQSCLTMALFKRTDSTYIIAVKTEFEMGSENYFLDYKNGKWTDISTQIIPKFSKKHIYELPQIGTTIEVYAKKQIEENDDYEISEKGEKLYDLEWEKGKFTIKR